MNKKNYICYILFILLIIGSGIYVAVNIKNRGENGNELMEYTASIYDKDGNIVNDKIRNREIIDVIENTTIKGVVELNSNGYIYIFNGQHFGEYGFEMKEYDRANIDNKNQECIDYYTLEKYNTNYIQEGDIIICTGDLIKYSIGDYNFDTKDNSIIVLKSKDYNKIKKDIINNIRTSSITVGEYFNSTQELYIKYDILEEKNSLPFVLKFNVTDDIQIIGNLEKGKELKIQYRDLDVPMDKLELKSIEVIEK